MKKHALVVCAAALLGGSMQAQQSSFQQPGWMAAPEPPGGGFGSAGRLNPPTFGLDGQASVSGRPFSGTEVRRSTQTLADGTHVDHSDTSRFYRDNQGRTRSESDTMAMIYDPVGGFIYTLRLSDKSYTKTAIGNNSRVSIAVVGNRTSLSTSNATRSENGGSSSGQIAPKKAERKAIMGKIQNATTNEELPGQSINGVYCRGSRITEVIPTGTFGNDRDVKITSERWYSDDLQVLVKTSNSDPRFGVTTYELTGITQAPPDPGLFQPPADFQLRENVVFGPARVTGTSK